jgi:UDPglucose 6-dehydrogenase
VNSRQRARMVEILLSELKILKGRKIGILGLSFKPFTDDLRDAPALDIASKLIERGAKVVAHDPVALTRAQKEWKEVPIEFVGNPGQVFDEADAVLLVTEWPEYKTLPFEKLAGSMRSKLVLDGRGLFDSKTLNKAGLRLITLGRASS